MGGRVGQKVAWRRGSLIGLPSHGLVGTTRPATALFTTRGTGFLRHLRSGERRGAQWFGHDPRRSGVQRVLAIGESQSAFRLTTYANEIDR